MATDAQIASLRSMLAEEIPAGSDETDTLFTNSQIAGFVDDANGNLEAAALAGWRNKAGQYANLVNVSEGAASRELGDLLDNAIQMVKLYKSASGGPTEGRTRIGQIVRPT